MSRDIVSFGFVKEIIVNKNAVTLRINISEGKQYTIQNINILGLREVDKKYIYREIISRLRYL